MAMIIAFAIYPSFSQDCCLDAQQKRLSYIRLAYTGEDCSSSDHMQAANQVSCIDYESTLGTQDPPDPVLIIAKNGKQGANKGDTLFIGLVSLWGTYLVEGTSTNQGLVGPSLDILILDETGTDTLQFTNFHTSCSQPIAAGDQFGANLITSLTFSQGEMCNTADYGDLPNVYKTLASNNGASHIIAEVNPYLGTVPPDAESDGNPDFLPSFFGDDTNSSDDEDGIQTELSFTSDEVFSIEIVVNNPLSEDVSVFAWFDRDYSNMFDIDIMDDEVRSDVVPAGTVNGTVTLDFGAFDPIPDNAGGITTYLRIRISSDPDVDMPTGLLSDGEVEDYHVTIQAAILPIELITFTANPTENQQVSVNWTTASESNNDYFEVERSEDGNTFYPIGKVAGAGSIANNSHYQLIDKQPTYGINFYRLKQVDFDGTHSFSKIIQVEMGMGSGLKRTMVFPNPAGSELRIQTGYSIEEDPLIQVYDLLGQLHHDILWNKIEVNGILNVSSLPPGQYYLRISTGGVTETIPFQKGF